MTRSGQVRIRRVMGSTSSAKLRYRLTGIVEPRWVFQPGWPGLGGPAGLVIRRPDVKASGEAWEKLVTVIAPGFSDGIGDRRIANTRDGKPVWIRPRRGVREGAPAAHRAVYALRRLLRKTAPGAASAHKAASPILGRAHPREG
ncbi:hypothetical protein MSEN_28250 [Mycolicibacter senuensis]|uniref:Uncharacterized protein n=1 Tax=Mycolicibacter senuensis TaxID=386913 RepID=A0A7I9XMA9_9MYCO|nr:hypothetical protein MSEN_28250 [Mycolicibacter senuensis]